MATKREVLGKKVQGLRGQGLVPAVLYGPALQPSVLSVARKEFDAVLKEAGESSLVSLEVGKEKTPVLIRGVQRHPISGEPIHVDFYQPRLDEKIKIMVPVSLEGEAPAQKELEGTLIQNVHEVEVAALPQDLPHEIVVDVSGLKTFEDRILVENLLVDSKVEIVSEKDWIVAQVVPAENVEEELAKPVEEAEAVASVEKVEEKKEEEVEEEPAVKEEKS
ncbi:MAG: 50S ribosomal protein L25 [bacterium]|nr:50S ribosomal protein L25 [bacterium]